MPLLPNSFSNRIEGGDTVKWARTYDKVPPLSLRCVLILLLVAIPFGSLKAEAPQLITILKNLDQPTDLVALMASDGSLRTEVIVAEGGTGRLLLVDKKGGTTLFAEGLTPGAIRLVKSAEGPLVASHAKVSVYDHDSISEVLVNFQSFGNQKVANKPLATGNPITDLAINDRYLFAIYDEQILRARRNDNRFTALRSFTVKQAKESLSQPRAICFGEKGHLLIACSDGNQALLTFCNPHESATPSLVSVEGINRIDSIAFGLKPRPAERRLYALVKSSLQNSENFATGLYRLDAMPPNEGRLRCQAKLIVPLERPLAFAMAPDGTAYFLALTEKGQGVLLHSNDQY